MTALLFPIGLALAFGAGLAFRLFERTDREHALAVSLALVWLGIALTLIGVGGLVGLGP